MKKILFTAIAAVLLAGCAKSVDEPVAKEIKVEFEIAEKSAFGADTKALKEGWAVGDVIRITFSSDEAGNNYPDFSNERYSLVENCGSHIITTDYPPRIVRPYDHVYDFDGYMMKLIK